MGTNQSRIESWPRFAASKASTLQSYSTTKVTTGRVHPAHWGRHRRSRQRSCRVRDCRLGSETRYRFRGEGSPYEATAKAWTQVRAAHAAGKITRTFNIDIEIHSPGQVTYSSLSSISEGELVHFRAASVRALWYRDVRGGKSMPLPPHGALKRGPELCPMRGGVSSRWRAAE